MHIPMRFEVCVTEDHISSGRPCAAQACPVALAVREKIGHIPEVKTVSVCDTVLDIVFSVPPNPYMNPKGRLSQRYNLPYEVGKFIRDFDSEKPVEPFSFECDAMGIYDVIAMTNRSP